MLDSESDLGAVFEERAEHLNSEDLRRWSATLPHDAEILKKLKGRGAKLLSGPRGSGKSTLLRRAYFDMLESGSCLPVYVNYARSLSLEPLFHCSANAVAIFRQWILSRIIVSIVDSLKYCSATIPSSLLLRLDVSNKLIETLEAGNVVQELIDPLTVSNLVVLIEQWTREVRRNSCVLLLDDAAHAFSDAQQREFFELFRYLKSNVVSAKAAVYPGVTAYSPNFHLGHEAELIEVWTDPDEPAYIDTMRNLVNIRVPIKIRNKARGKEELIDFLALASFGIPRAFLTMLSTLLGIDEEEINPVTNARALESVSSLAHSVRSVFMSLSQKLPRYRHFIELGDELIESIANNLKEYNYNRSLTMKGVVIGLSAPIEPQLSKILGLMEYAGIIRNIGQFSRGNRGIYQRYTLHYAKVISDNVLNLGKSGSISNSIIAIKTRNAHAVSHSRLISLLNPNYIKRCKLDLAPCQKCGEQRLMESAKFCMKCGAELANLSIYEELLKAPLRFLPLTKKRLSALHRHTVLRTVQDVLLDRESIELRRVPYVGPVWAKRIHTMAEEFVSV